jgi:hypothetical protein
LDDLGMGLAEALLASMPRYADQYPSGLVQKVWPQKLVIGESDAFTIKGSEKTSPARISKS